MNLDWVIQMILDFKDQIEAFKKVIDDFQEYVDILVNLDPRVSALESEYTSLRLRVVACENNISTLSINLQNESNTRLAVDTDLQEQINRISEQLVDINALYNKIKIYVDESIKGSDHRTDAKIYRVYLKISEVFNELMLYVNDLYEKIDMLATGVYNWTAYAYSNDGIIDFDLNNKLLYRHLGNNLNSVEYCKLGFTASEYAAFNLTADEYLMYSRDRLHYDYVYMPIAGKRQNTSVAIDEIVNYIFNTISSLAYSALDLTADDYASLNITALDYLRMNDAGELSSRLVYTNSGSGITADQYSHLSLIN